MNQLRFLVSLITADNDYQAEQAATAKATGQKLGVDVDVIFADGDPINQSQQLLNVIQSDKHSPPNAILMEPAGSTALPQVARAAAAAGIGWVVLNREADYVSDLRREYRVPIFTLSGDQIEVGRIQGKQFAALLPEGGSMLYIQGPWSSSVSHQRTAGMYETKPGNIQIKVLKSSNWTEAGGHHAVSSWLRLSTSQHEHIDLVGGQNDSLAMGARKALHELVPGSEHEPRPEIPFTGVDGLPKTGQEWVRRRILAATIIVPPMTSIGMEILVATFRSGSMPPEARLIPPVSFPRVEELSRNRRN
jgi:ribose transport system substrate-binding protein